MNSEPNPEQHPEQSSETNPEQRPEVQPEARPELHRLHPVAMLIGAIKTIRRWVGAAAIPGIAALAGTGWRLELAIVGVLVLVVGSGVWGVLSWRATTYSVSGGAFYVRRGVLQKSERTIPLEHVQSVDTVQGIVQRLFSVVELRVETAGGGTNEPDATLSALDRGAAEALRREIEGSRQAVENEENSGLEVVRKLSTRELLVAGATSGQIGVALSLVAVASQVFDNFLPNNLTERIFDLLAPRSLTVFLFLVLALALLAWLLSIGGTVLAYSGFTLSRDGDFLYIRRGLLERREATLPLARIQAVRIVEGVLRQPFGLAMVRVESAGYGSGTEDVGVSTTLFPLLPRKDAERLLRAAAPEFVTEASLEPLPDRARRRYIVRALIPAFLIALAIGLNVWFAAGSVPLSLLALLLLPPAALLGFFRYRAAGWALDRDRLVVRSRSLARVTSVVPRRRIQSRSVVESPFQRRADLATFRARVASGSGGTAFRIMHLEAFQADDLLDKLGPAHRPESGAQAPRPDVAFEN